MATDANEEVRRLWDTVAPGWERYRAEVFEGQRAVSEWLVGAIDARDDDTILELTAGPGETGLMLAERVPGARVIVSDFAPRMVEAARAEVARRALTNVDVRQIDAQRIDLPDASVQGVMSRYGLMLMPEMKAAVSEVRRVLADGRAFAYAVWGPLQANPWMFLFGAAFVQRGHFTPPEGGAFFPLTTEDENRALVAAAGFDRVEVETIEVPQRFANVEEYWAMNSSVAGPLAVIAQGLSDEQKADLRATLEEFVTPFRTDDGITLPSQTIVVRAS